MTSDEWITLLEQYRVIAVIRSSDTGVAMKMAESMIQAGIRLIEITWNSHRPEVVIEKLTQAYPHCVIGTGTILTQDHLQKAIAGGARFAFSPHTNTELIQQAYTQDVPMIPGALSPSEIVTAWQAGAASVKVFPIKTMGGPEYLKSLRGPLGHIPLIPTGGVTMHNAIDFLETGAIAVGLSTHLFPKPLVLQENWSMMTERAKTLVNRLRGEGWLMR
ncbi:MAG: bifunctional 4-hydroxy-2-oxoglutarate aldolase/2-dehydro-3-deoxy-phosphogluconate aldolase [Merismopedia sp. SIO2A8]|nr:bifunctional 4-hydroxy-2-oxoglutarate aldolase/2-dehydro-3-deoxy-phosphogluconate aldolase [Merismopedia sp. SIO2A8]